jgi:Rha family phage regulatory protein
MAKELSMVERNEKGKEARKYFIQMMKNAENLLENLEIVNYSSGGSNLVFTKGGVPYTSSNIIAERFCKNHKDVMRSIDNHLVKNTDDLMVSDFNRRNFTPVEFLDNKHELRRAYELTEEGFSFTALGFTGEKADKFKIEFIQAFFEIRDALQNRIKAEIARDLFPCTTTKRNFVYVLSNSDNGYLKVGVSSNVDKRIKQLQTGSWAELSVEYRSMVCSNSFDIESTVHEKLRSKRVRGEWYDVSISDAISLIESEDHQLRTPLLKVYYEGCKAQMFKMDIKND